MFFWFAVFVIVSIWNVTAPWSTESWARYYHVVGFGLPVIFALVTGTWFTWGGILDLRALFRRLSAEKLNDLDDGTVVGHQNLDETARSVAAAATPHDAAKPASHEMTSR
jgi:SSS family solute:Na+ symporter